MSTTADHTPESVNGPDPEGPLSVNSTPDPSTNTPADAPVNATDDDAANAAVTRGGNVVPIRPDTARTADEIPEQDRPAADDAEPGAAVRLVDPPATKATWWETAGHATARPLVARWLTSAEEFRSRARFLVRYAAHTTAFHALRVPVYVPTAFLRSFGATGRLVARLRAWVYDAESHPVRMNARDRADAELYMKLREIRNETVRRRMGPVMVGVVVLLAIVYLCITFVTPFWNWTGLVVAMTLVGWWGAPADKPVAGRAVDSIKTPKLTSSMIEERALLPRDRWPEPGVCQGRQRHRVPEPDHPRRPRLARGGRPPVRRDGRRRDRHAATGSPPGCAARSGCVWPEADAEAHTGRLVLWVGDQDMSKAKQPPWPLPRPAPVDLFKPEPFGTDQRGRLGGHHADVRRPGSSARSRAWARRSCCGCCCSSPRWTRAPSCTRTTSRAPATCRRSAPVAHRYRAGDDDEDIDIRAGRPAGAARGAAAPDEGDPRPAAGHLPGEQGHPGAGRRASARAAPDRGRRWTSARCGSSTPSTARSSRRSAPTWSSAARRSGIMLLLATQRPDAKSLPDRHLRQRVLRFCLRSWARSRTTWCSGTSAYKRGMRATMFACADKGIGYFVGEGDDARDRPPRLHRRPRRRDDRRRAPARRASRPGSCTGHAVGESRGGRRPRGYDLLADILAVIAGRRGEGCGPRPSSTRLAELRPGRSTAGGPREQPRRRAQAVRHHAPSRCGAPTRRRARAPTATATPATPSPPPRTTERNQSQRLGAVRVLDRTAPRPRPLL